MTDLSPARHTNPLRFFFAVNKKQLPLIGLNVLCYSLGTVGAVGMAYYVGRIIDRLSGDPAALRQTIVLFVLSLVLHEAFYRIGHICEVVIHARIRANVKKALYAYTSRLSYSYFADRFAGQLSHQISAVAEALRRMEETIVNKFIDNSVLFGISVVAMTSIYRPLGWALFGWLVLFLIGIRFIVRKLTLRAEAFAEQESSTTGKFVDTYTNVAAVKVYSDDFDASRLFRQISAEYRSELSLGKWTVIAYGYQGFSAVILGIALLIVIAHGYGLGLVSVGGIVAVAGIALRLIEYVYEVGSSMSDFVRNRGECVQALKDIIVTPAIIDGKNHCTADEGISLAFQDVDFSYNVQKKILNHFSLSIPAGQRIGIVGLSGVGKTTIVNLLLRFYEPQSGTVMLSGTDISTITQASLRSQIAHISQDTSLFHTSVAENIGYGLPDASRQDIERAAKMAYADEFIQTLPKGYDTVVGERGVKLSGGQRQRIAIARAILKDAPLFLLDEATSALDSDSEAKVQEALKVAMQGKTVVAIAHRLSTLQYMDRIVYMENGVIIEDGTHDELIVKGGKYATLWKMQAGGFLPAHIENI